MILIESDVVDINGKPFFEAFEGFQDGVDHLRFQDGSAILDGELDVVVALGDIVVPAPHIPIDVRHWFIVAGCCLWM